MSFRTHLAAIMMQGLHYGSALNLSIPHVYLDQLTRFITPTKRAALSTYEY